MYKMCNFLISVEGYRYKFNKPFWPLLTGAEGMVILTGVTVLARGRTLLLAAFGLCLGAIDVSVGPTESVILERRKQKLWLGFP